MSECPAGIVGGECDERPSGACDADGPDLCMAYWRWAARKQRARAEAAAKRVAELEGDAERLADELRETSKALWAIANAAADKHLDDIRGPIACAAIAAQADEALAAHEALRGTK